MTTSKGTIQGYTGVGAVDKKRQVITDAQAFGAGQEHHTLLPVLETLKKRYHRLGFSDDLFDDDIIITADTGFANEANMKYLHDNNINAYIPDNQFRTLELLRRSLSISSLRSGHSRDPKFTNQKEKYGKRHQNTKKCKTKGVIPASEFTFDPKAKMCVCPAGNTMCFRREVNNKNDNHKLFFEGKLTDCRHCTIKHRCMRNPESAGTLELLRRSLSTSSLRSGRTRLGHGRQVSFIMGTKKTTQYTDWMKPRVDSDEGKLIYSHRMSVVEPVFGNIGFNKKLNRFSLRGKQKVQCQWKLFCIVHNIEKLANYGQLAA